MKPIIAMLGAVDEDLSSKLLRDYTRAIEKSGGAPILFPYLEDCEVIDRLVCACDGFCFTGGVDIDPARYGEEKSEYCGEIAQSRDRIEFEVITRALKSKKPIFAICRGIQLLNVALGGKLYQDIPSQLGYTIHRQEPNTKYNPSHDVSICPDTPLYSLIGKKKMAANSFHHQAIKVLGEGLSVMATADDGTIEAVYLVGDSYVRGYQWHPERLYYTDNENKSLFDDFILACRTIKKV